MRNLIMIAVVILLLNACSTYRCYPSKHSKDYAHTHIHKTKRGWLVVHIKGFTRQQYAYECLPDSLNQLYTSAK